MCTRPDHHVEKPRWPHSLLQCSTSSPALLQLSAIIECPAEKRAPSSRGSAQCVRSCQGCGAGEESEWETPSDSKPSCSLPDGHLPTYTLAPRWLWWRRSKAAGPRTKSALLQVCLLSPSWSRHASRTDSRGIQPSAWTSSSTSEVVPEWVARFSLLYPLKMHLSRVEFSPALNRWLAIECKLCRFWHSEH